MQKYTALLFTGSLFQYLQQLLLVQAEARLQKLNLTHPQGWQAWNYAIISWLQGYPLAGASISDGTELKPGTPTWITGALRSFLMAMQMPVPRSLFVVKVCLYVCSNIVPFYFLMSFGLFKFTPWLYHVYLRCIFKIMP